MNLKSKTIPIKPVIKWSGSKRSQASEIIRHIPKFNRYYEPFVGGANIAYALRPESGICGDICKPLIELWKLIQTEPESLYSYYLTQWNRLQNEGYQVFYEIRSNFNSTFSPYDLFFLTRTCVNGLIRFNRDGQFNNSFHHSRKGIKPHTLRIILYDWSKALQGIEFRFGDYRETTQDITSKDFVYLDPPYFNTRGRYYGTIDYQEFLSYLEELNSKDVRYALSFDGYRENKDYSVDLPKHLYKRHILLGSGNSTFKKVMDRQSQQVFESLYLNW